MAQTTANEMRETAEQVARMARQPGVVERLSPDERRKLGVVLEAYGKQAKRDRYFDLYPEDGPLSRHAYRKHMEHFAAGKWARERAVLGGNRVGKTEMGAYEMSAHLTGLYPDWWEGRRFDSPVNAWAAGKTNDTTKVILQEKLFGGVRKDERDRNRLAGKGMIPADRIMHESATFRAGFPGLISEVGIRYRDSRLEHSVLGVKAYEQGRRAFEGTAQHVIWLDEEPPEDIYGECLMRTGTVDGMVYLTFTPLDGLTEVVTRFLPEELRPPVEIEDDEYTEH